MTFYKLFSDAQRACRTGYTTLYCPGKGFYNGIAL